MKQAYDGLMVVRIPMTHSDIFTGSGGTCKRNVLNVEQDLYACISETQGDTTCWEYTEHRSYQWIGSCDATEDEW